MNDKKRIERWYLEAAQKVCPLFPSEAFEDSECPDFKTLTDGGTLGVEVTHLFQRNPEGGFPPKQVEEFHESVIRTAAQIWQASASFPVDVLAVCDERESSRRNALATASSLVEFVRSNYVPRCVTLERRQFDAALPNGFDVVRIAPPDDGATNKWQVGHFGTTPLLTRADVEREIQRKNGLVGAYRQNVERVWLVMVASIFPRSASFIIPAEVQEWSFPFDFDKVLLFDESHSRVLDLQRKC
jgi:hypothetical protein